MPKLRDTLLTLVCTLCMLVVSATSTVLIHRAIPNDHYTVSPLYPKVLLPDPRLTPGDVDTTDLKIVCEQSTKVRRHVPASMKHQIYAEYEESPNGSDCKAGCEVDHKVPLACGGSNSKKNLWIQFAFPHPGYHEKDVVEAWAHNSVCRLYKSGQHQQAQALLKHFQQGFERDWFRLELEKEGK